MTWINLNLPHRAAGCHWSGADQSEEDSLLKEPWLSALDLSVYHLHGADKWQAYRRAMTKVQMDQKHAWLLQWLLDHGYRPELEMSAWSDVLHEDIVRVMNLCRSHRGQWREYPEIKKLAGLLVFEWDRRKVAVNG